MAEKLVRERVRRNLSPDMRFQVQATYWKRSCLRLLGAHPDNGVSPEPTAKKQARNYPIEDGKYLPDGLGSSNSHNNKPDLWHRKTCAKPRGGGKVLKPNPFSGVQAAEQRREKKKSEGKCCVPDCCSVRNYCPKEQQRPKPQQTSNSSEADIQNVSTVAIKWI
jgi:hypothetical protein